MSELLADKATEVTIAIGHDDDLHRALQGLGLDHREDGTWTRVVPGDQRATATRAGWDGVIDWMIDAHDECESVRPGWSQWQIRADRLMRLLGNADPEGYGW
ncbi:MAG: hypothetical protein JWM89_1521 [Acidimicrobiales bacterium]|nr:hypothetical protein [Acidimicrobiales bacterium]